MNFKLKKNEIVLLSVLGILLYIFLFYKFIWVPVVPEIMDQKDRIAELTLSRDKLNQELQNLDNKKLVLISKQAGNERLEGYLNNEANVSDCLDYMGKLSGIVGDGIKEVNIGTPEKKEVNSSQYYEIKINYSIELEIDKFKDMLSYIENSSKIMKISRFDIKSNKTEENQNTGINTPVSDSDKYKADITLIMYALDLEAADRLYEYGRHKFNRYEYGNGSEGSDVQGVPETAGVPTGGATDTNTGTTNDFQINYSSFLMAGDNFKLRGFDKDEERLDLKTNEFINMELDIGGNTYDIKAEDSKGKKYGVSGAVPNRDLNMLINVIVSQIEENKDIGLKIKVINNSGNKLNIILNDTSGRATVTDRQGTEIRDKNEQEKVYIK